VCISAPLEFLIVIDINLENFNSKWSSRLLRKPLAPSSPLSLELQVHGEEEDWAEMLAAAAEDEPAAVKPRSSSRGHEGNKKYFIASNIKAFGRLFAVDPATIRALSAGRRRFNAEQTRFAIIGAAVRTQEAIRSPGLLLFRSWHGRVPGVELISVTEKTGSDSATTPVMALSNGARAHSAFPRNLFHVDDVVPGMPDAM